MDLNCNPEYKSSLWTDIRFPEGRNYEDIDTMYRIFDLCHAISMTDQVLYFHRKRPGSITQTPTRRNLEDMMLACLHLEEFVRLHTPEIFCEAQILKWRQSRLNGLMAYYAKQMPLENAVELRNEIIDMGKEIKTGAGQFGFRTRTGYWMICYCPWLLRMLYPFYHVRVAEMQIIGR